MASFANALRLLLSEGRLVVSEPPQPRTDHHVEAILREAFDAYRLEIAGPPLAWQREVGCAAAKFLERSAWFLFDMTTPADDVAKLLFFLQEPRTADEHLSVDLLFRYLPPIWRRARNLGHHDRLAANLANVLRRWPLSGVLAELPGEPTGPLDFGRHPGLKLLYAERLAEHFAPAWLPPENERGHVELVWTELGRGLEELAAPKKEVEA